MNLLELLGRQAAERPRAPAIIDEARRGGARVTTFAALDEAAARTAAWLRDLGLGAGDATLVFYPMSAELYVVLLALFRLRAVAMFLDPSAGRDHVERCCALQAPRALIAGARAHLLRLWSPALRRVPIAVSCDWPVPFARRLRHAARSAPLGPIPDTPAETPALLTFTSGSTGAPKAAVRSHGFLLHQHRMLQATLHLEAGAVDLTTLPIVLLANLGSGVTSVIPDADLRYPGAVAPGPILDQIRAHGVVSSTASPAFFESLIRFARRRGLTLPGLRKLFSGGAPVFPRLLAGLQALAPGAEVVAVYGSTEAEPIAHIARRALRPSDLAAMVAGRGLLTGPPVPGTHLRILPDRWGRPLGPYTAAAFEAECLPPEGTGEIVVTGDHVLKGYLHGHGDAETKFRVDGTTWHRTGDAGRLDDEGRLWLLGRCAARIADAKGELYPFAVECAAHETPGVRRAAAVAHAGRRLLAIEPDPEGPPPDLPALHSALAWAALDEVRRCRRIPVDPRHNAKVDYPALHRMLGRD